MNSKDKAFLVKFRLTESSNLTGLENFGATDSPITSRLGWYSTYESKNCKSPLIRVPPPDFYIFPIKALLLTIAT